MLAYAEEKESFKERTKELQLVLDVKPWEHNTTTEKKGKSRVMSFFLLQILFL